MIIGANGASGGLGALIGGTQSSGSAAGGGLGSTIGQISGALGQLTGGGGGNGGGFGAMLGSMGTMAATGASIGGPYGAAAGAALGLITSIGSAFGIGNHPAPNHEDPDEIRIAAANDITQQQAADVCGWYSETVPDPYDGVCSQAANDNNFFLRILGKYNSAHANNQIKTQTQVATEQAAPQYLQLQTQLANTFAGSGTASPLANLSFPAAQAAAKQQNMTLSDYLSAIVNGALTGLQKGVSDAVAETPAAQDLKKSVIKDWVKENQLIVAGAGIGLAWLISQAVQNNRK